MAVSFLGYSRLRFLPSLDRTKLQPRKEGTSGLDGEIRARAEEVRKFSCQRAVPLLPVNAENILWRVTTNRLKMRDSCPETSEL